MEAYFLDHNRQYVFQNKFTAIILKLMCYYPIAVFSYDNYRLIRYPSPQTVVDLIAHAKNTLGILFGENTLFLFEKDGLNISVYNPNHDMQELITSLAQAEGLFWRKSEVLFHFFADLVDQMCCFPFYLSFYSSLCFTPVKLFRQSHTADRCFRICLYNLHYLVHLS